MLSGVGDILSGGGSSGYQRYQDQLGRGMDAVNSNYDKGRAYGQPWYDAGTGMIPGYQQELDNYRNAPDMYDNILSNWEQSAGATNQIEAATRAAKNMGAASGMTASPALQEALAKDVSGIVAGDQNNYLSTILGMKDRYLQGANGMMDRGYNAGMNMGNSYYNQGNVLAGLYGDMGQAQLGQQVGRASAWANGAGMAANFLGGF